MKLRELVTYRNHLINTLQVRLNSTPLSDNSGIIDKLSRTTAKGFEQYVDDVDGMSEQCKSIASAYNNVTEDFKVLIERVEKDIDTWSDEMFDEYQEIFTFENLAIRLNSVKLSDEIAVQIKDKISLHGDNWRYPGLQFFPTSVEWVKTMVSMDPLYLAGPPLTYLENLVKDYPQQYQNRLRLYQIPPLDFVRLPQEQFGFVNQIPPLDFVRLPQEQFGFIFCLAVLKFLHSTYLEDFITRAFDLLRPGGVFVFGYNNCGTDVLVDSAEFQEISYYSNRKLRALCDKVGYEIISLEDLEGFGGLAEIRKPGTLTTVKIHQAMAQILVK
jgi:hypothetical protein